MNKPELTKEQIEAILRKKEMGYGMTNSEIRALHDFNRVPHRPIVDRDRTYTPIVNQVVDRVHKVSTTDADIISNAVASTTKLPFQPVFAGTSTTITYGTLNGVAPTNIGSTFSVPTSGTRYLVLTGSSSSGSVTSSSLSVTTTPPTMVAATYGFPPATFTVLLYVIVNQTLFRVIGPGSLYALPKESFRVQKSMPTPDLLPYDSYYNWLVSNV